jgi:hypothetical protein
MSADIFTELMTSAIYGINDTSLRDGTTEVFVKKVHHGFEDKMATMTDYQI